MTMPAMKDFAMSILVAAVPVGLAAAILLLRDRRTLRPEMSTAERRRAVDNNTEKTMHWWHLIVLAGIFAAMALNLGKLAHQQARVLVVEAAVAAFLVFRYYRKRSEESIDPPRPSRQR